MAIRLFDDPVPDMQTAMARVNVGAHYLDRKYGADWDTLIDPDRLDIASPCRCILGQLCANGHFGALFTPARIALDGGFLCGAWDMLFFWLPPSVDHSFKRLTKAWRIVLMRRTAARVERDRPPVWKTAKTRNREHSHTRRSTISCSA